MNTATPPTASARTPAARSRRRARPTTRKSTTPACQLNTQRLIAHIWDTPTEWGKTLQLAFLMAIAGITIFAVLTGLGLLAHAAGPAAAWPVSVSITGTVTYQIGHRKRR